MSDLFLLFSAVFPLTKTRLPCDGSNGATKTVSCDDDPLGSSTCGGVEGVEDVLDRMGIG